MKTKRILILPVLFALVATTGCKTGRVQTDRYNALTLPYDCGVVRNMQIDKAIRDGDIEILNDGKPVSETASVRFPRMNAFLDMGVKKQQRRNEKIEGMVKESVSSIQSKCPDADALIDATATTRIETSNYGIFYCWVPVIGWFGPHFSQNVEYTVTGTPIRIKPALPGKPAGGPAPGTTPAEPAAPDPAVDAMIERLMDEKPAR